ncbi:MAG: serine hydrolase [Bacillota bacterium]|nr:serine hydrolase [Bacillota bacterium]
MDQTENIEEAARVRRMQRIKEMQEKKRKQMMFRRYVKRCAPFVTGAVLLLFVILIGNGIFHKVIHDQGNDGKPEGQEQYAENEEANDSNVISVAGGNQSLTEMDNGEEESGKDETAVQAVSQNKHYSASTTDSTINIGEEVMSSYGILIDLSNDTVLAQRASKTKINPASMTKILTVLVAAEHVEDLDDTFTMTLEITDYGYINDCSSAGFAEDEKVTVRDLFYGTILPSGADAAVALATYVAGDQDAFVKMMNEKLVQLGLSDTAHMTNCVGIYDEEHYCTAYDMAMILEAAIDNELCREVLSAHTYTTSKTEQHPEGITISNWFLRRIEDKDTGGEVICAKTGYVVQSGNCAASYGVDMAGKEYICVTADAHSAWRCIYDHVELYKQFATLPS